MTGTAAAVTGMAGLYRFMEDRIVHSIAFTAQRLVFNAFPDVSHMDAWRRARMRDKIADLHEVRHVLDELHRTTPAQP